MPKVTFPLISQDLWILTRAFKTVTSKSGQGVYASSDTLFKGAIFGRDSLEVAEDILELKPKLVRDILKTMAALQGIRNEKINEEEIGKIVHEYRQLYVDGKPLDDMSRLIFYDLTAKWGLDGNSLIYYGSVDATPLFVRVLCDYVSLYGRSILKQRVVHRDGLPVTMLASLTSAVKWLLKRLTDSTTGLLEYQRHNPKGIENQVWKDSKEFYVHESGEFANFNAPISSIEVQGLVYDALLGAAGILPEMKDQLEIAAAKLQARTIELLWLPKRTYFALGVDHDPKEVDRLRVIMTTTANPAALLDTSFFNSLPADQKEQFITAIVTKITGPEFVTDAGIRSRSLDESKLINYWDYHGSFTSWPKETYDIAKGLRRQGFPKLARQLENRLLNVIKKSHSYPEFVYVDENGRVLTGAPAATTHGSLTLVDSNIKPESIQAWTISAAMAILMDRSTLRLDLKPEPDLKWQKALEKQIMADFPKIERLKWSREIQARYPTYPYKLAS